SMQVAEYEICLRCCALGPRRHGMAIDQYRHSKAAAGLFECVGDGPMVRAVYFDDSPRELFALDRSLPDRSCPGNPRRNKSQAAARTRRGKDRSRWRGWSDDGWIDLPFVPVEINFG